MDILNEIKKRYKTGSIVFKLIFINVGVFLAVSLVELFVFLFSVGGQTSFTLIDYLAVPADLPELLRKPWTILTYMFLHYDFLHILFNMLWLFWFGKIFLEYLEPKRLLSIYLLGGFFGAVLYIASFNLLPAFKTITAISVALGASASVYAIVIAISAYVPDYSIGLLFIGRVKLKYIAIFVVVLDLLSIAKGNPGGHIAHLGGALFGYLFAIRLKKGKDITKGFSATMDYLLSQFKSKPKMRVSENKFKTSQQSKKTAGPKSSNDLEYNKQKADLQAEIDRILDKISKYGYDSLSKDEKNTLFDQRKKD
jgi:membrane associated rhomboid family serine protease